MFYQTYFPDVTFFVVPYLAYNISISNWYLSENGITRVLGEVRRCGEQFTEEDIKYMYGREEGHGN